MSDEINRLAEEVALEATESVYKAIGDQNSFILEAGAGSGKTHTLIEALKYIISKSEKGLQKNKQKIACITFTNAAADVIKSRIDSNPIVVVDTIHSFCWSLIKDFQPLLRKEIVAMDRWTARVDEDHKIEYQVIEYNLGYPKIYKESISIHHNDVIEIVAKLMKNQKFCGILEKKYPFLLIDEYQDTNMIFFNSLVEAFLNVPSDLVVGLFGDSWQKIYGDGCGKISHPNLRFIKQSSNFRSSKTIVDCLNKIRPDLGQVAKDDSKGSINIFTTNLWGGSRQTGPHWDGDLPTEVSEEIFNKTISTLEKEGWDFDPSKTKILMLTNNVLAKQQGYSNLLDAFEYKEGLTKKENETISFLIDTVEPISNAFKANRFGEVSSLLGSKSFISSQKDKIKWREDMATLLNLRTSGTIGDVLDHLIETGHPKVPERITQKISLLKEVGVNKDPNFDMSAVELLGKIRLIKYTELIAATKFINNQTPFSTKHGVKGEEYENVLIIFGRGWSQYNFGQFLAWETEGIPNGKEEFFERNRNLFYVVCSRPKKRLALLFTQFLSDDALKTIGNWFGTNNIISII